MGEREDMRSEKVREPGLKLMLARCSWGHQRWHSYTLNSLRFVMIIIIITLNTCYKSMKQRSLRQWYLIFKNPFSQKALFRATGVYWSSVSFYSPSLMITKIHKAQNLLLWCVFTHNLWNMQCLKSALGNNYSIKKQSP